MNIFLYLNIHSDRKNTFPPIAHFRFSKDVKGEQKYKKGKMVLLSERCIESNLCYCWIKEIWPASLKDFISAFQSLCIREHYTPVFVSAKIRLTQISTVLTSRREKNTECLASQCLDSSQSWSVSKTLLLCWFCCSIATYLADVGTEYKVLIPVWNLFPFLITCLRRFFFTKFSCLNSNGNRYPYRNLEIVDALIYVAIGKCSLEFASVLKVENVSQSRFSKMDIMTILTLMPTLICHIFALFSFIDTI